MWLDFQQTMKKLCTPSCEDMLTLHAAEGTNVSLSHLGIFLNLSGAINFTLDILSLAVVNRSLFHTWCTPPYLSPPPQEKGTIKINEQKARLGSLFSAHPRLLWNRKDSEYRLQICTTSILQPVYLPPPQTCPEVCSSGIYHRIYYPLVLLLSRFLILSCNVQDMTHAIDLLSINNFCSVFGELS